VGENKVEVEMCEITGKHRKKANEKNQNPPTREVYKGGRYKKWCALPSRSNNPGKGTKRSTPVAKTDLGRKRDKSGPQTHERGMTKQQSALSKERKNREREQGGRVGKMLKHWREGNAVGCLSSKEGKGK